MKIGMLFPGYGGQFVGMGKDLYDEHRSMQEYFEEASNCLNMNFVKLCFASSDQEITRMDVAYPSVFLLGCSFLKLLQENGINPTMVAGYDAGVYTALLAAECLNFPDGLYILRKYGEFYGQLLTQVDVSVINVSGLSGRVLKKLCDEYENVHIAAYFTPREHFVSGPTEYIRSLTKDIRALAKKDSVEILHNAIGLHSALMEPVVNSIAMYLAKVDFNEIKIPCINTVNGKPMKTGGKDIQKVVLNRISQSIRWDKVMGAFAECDALVAMGPGTKLADAARVWYPEKQIFAFNNKADLHEICSALVPS